MANSVDPDEAARYEPSHQDLHCLQKCALVRRAERVKVENFASLFNCIDGVSDPILSDGSFGRLTPDCCCPLCFIAILRSFEFHCDVSKMMQRTLREMNIYL